MRLTLLLTTVFLISCGDKGGEGTDVGDCTDGADKDGSGDVDCHDAGCAGSPDYMDDGTTQ